MASIPERTGIIYSRVSSTDQVENTSLESQEARCREYARQNGIRVLGVFVERGESAKTQDRTEFLKAIAFCADKKQHVGVFIVYKLDRFARNQEDHVMVRSKLKQYGTELRSATEPINETPVGRAMEGMISVFAELDNSIRTERTKMGLQERVKQGIWVWQAPLGYYRPIKRRNIAPDPKTAPLILLAFEEFAKGTHTYASLAKHVAARGLRTRHGAKPRAQLMEKIIHNPLYAGKIVAFGATHQGAFQPIVGEKLFAPCQPLYKPLHHSGPRFSNNPAFPLRRLVVCGACGEPLTASYCRGRHGKRYPYYHHHLQGCAKATFIPADTLERGFVGLLDTITPSPRFEKLFRAIVLDYWTSQFSKVDQEQKRVRREIEALERERQKVFELHRTGIYTDADFVQQRAILSEQIEQKERLLRAPRVEPFDMKLALENYLGLVRSTSRVWQAANHENRLRFQKHVFAGDKVLFDGMKFGTTKLAPVYELGRGFSGQKSSLVAQVGLAWNRILEELQGWQGMASAFSGDNALEIKESA